MKFDEHQLPRAYHLKCLSNLSEEEIESGCRDSAPSRVSADSVYVVSSKNRQCLRCLQQEPIVFTLSLARTDSVYVDATGTVLLGDKSCYAYEIVVLHWLQHHTSQQATTYHPFPTFFNHFATLKVLYTEKDLCDGSTALMNAIVLSMFKETFKNYLHGCWLIASWKYTSSFCELPILHLCASHFMKNAKKLVKER